MKYLLFLVGICLLFFATPVNASSSDLAVKPGETIAVPVAIDKADKLAGVKLVLEYDKDLLTFSKADKSAQTASLMHIVNSKNPGKLIIVFAGARGISGKDLPLMTLWFTVPKTITKKQTVDIHVSKLELINENLAAAKGSINIPTITITP